MCLFRACSPASFKFFCTTAVQTCRLPNYKIWCKTCGSITFKTTRVWRRRNSCFRQTPAAFPLSCNPARSPSTPQTTPPSHPLPCIAGPNLIRWPSDRPHLPLQMLWTLPGQSARQSASSMLGSLAGAEGGAAASAPSASAPSVSSTAAPSAAPRPAPAWAPGIFQATTQVSTSMAAQGKPSAHHRGPPPFADIRELRMLVRPSTPTVLLPQPQQPYTLNPAP